MDVLKEYQTVLKRFQEVFKGVSRKFQESSWGGSKKFEDFLMEFERFCV